MVGAANDQWEEVTSMPLQPLYFLVFCKLDFTNPFWFLFVFFVYLYFCIFVKLLLQVLSVQSVSQTLSDLFWIFSCISFFFFLVAFYKSSLILVCIFVIFCQVTFANPLCAALGQSRLQLDWLLLVQRCWSQLTPQISQFLRCLFFVIWNV